MFTPEERMVLEKSGRPTTPMDPVFKAADMAEKLIHQLEDLEPGMPPMAVPALGPVLRGLQWRINDALTRLGLEPIEIEARVLESPEDR